MVTHSMHRNAHRSMGITGGAPDLAWNAAIRGDFGRFQGFPGAWSPLRRRRRAAARTQTRGLCSGRESPAAARSLIHS
jgi:hypothetical protein